MLVIDTSRINNKRSKQINIAQLRAFNTQYHCIKGDFQYHLGKSIIISQL